MHIAPAPQAPPFCPNDACHYHRHDRHLWKFVKMGFYFRSIPPHRVQRWRCDACRRHFGTQTFRLTYWLHRPELLVPLFWRMNACSSFRQAARDMKAAPSTLTRQGDRLGRHSLLFHEQMRPKGLLEEPLALDGFESFEYSQYHPTSWHVAVGKHSHYFYGFTDSELRRKGRMTAGQRKRRAKLEDQLGRPDPKSVEMEVAALLSIVAAGSEAIELHTDEHPAYPRALRRLPRIRVVHRTVSSRAARNAQNPLFGINLLDFVIRHNGANHKRETSAFSKRRAGAAYRLFVFLVLRDYVLPFSTRRGGPTPAMRAGVTDRPCRPEEILGKRRFVSRSNLPGRWKEYYWRRSRTRAIPNGRVHARKYAI